MSLCEVRKRGAGVAAILVLAASMFLPGCSRKSGKAKKSKPAEARPKPGQPDHVGRYTYTVSLPPKYPCRTRADCDLTQLRPGDCCPDQCDYTAATRAWVLAVRKLHYPICVKFLKEYGFDAVCGRPRCKPLEGRPKAQCKEGKCTVQYIPVVPR